MNAPALLGQLTDTEPDHLTDNQLSADIWRRTMGDLSDNISFGHVDRIVIDQHLRTADIRTRRAVVRCTAHLVGIEAHPTADNLEPRQTSDMYTVINIINADRQAQHADRVDVVDRVAALVGIRTTITEPVS